MRVLGRKRHVFDLKLVELQLFLGRVDDFEADVDRVALHLAVGAQLGEGYGGVAMTDGDRLGFGDALHHGTILGARNRGKDDRGYRNERSCKCVTHFGWLPS